VKYAIKAGVHVVDHADTLADASKKLRAAVRMWRNGLLVPTYQKSARSSYTANRWDRGTRRAAGERQDTGALPMCWELRDRKYGFFGWARVEATQP
jgi:hypothetical protein